MSNLSVRILFALVAVPFSLWLLWQGPITRYFFLSLLATVGAWEWARMVDAKLGGPKLVFWLAPIASLSLTATWLWNGPLGLVTALWLLVFIALAFARVPIESLFLWLVLQFAGPLYLGLWGGAGSVLMGKGQGFAAVYPFLVVLVGMWVCDSFAYFTGRAFGRHKLAPSISPKKTWEGAFGGTAVTVLFVALVGPYVFGLSLLVNIGLGILLAVSGQLGDLLMSALKRWSGIKDSSHIFPGHGGVLDRFDSYYLSGPMIAFLLASGLQ